MAEPAGRGRVFAGLSRGSLSLSGTGRGCAAGDATDPAACRGVWSGSEARGRVGIFGGRTFCVVSGDARHREAGAERGAGCSGCAELAAGLYGARVSGDQHGAAGGAYGFAHEFSGAGCAGRVGACVLESVCGDEGDAADVFVCDDERSDGTGGEQPGFLSRADGGAGSGGIAPLRLRESWMRAVRIDSAAGDVARAAAELAGAAGRDSAECAAASTADAEFAGVD